MIKKYLLLCILTAAVSISQQTDDVITPTSVNVVALPGSDISLGWTVSILDDDIKWCYWQFKPNGMSTWTRLVGWDNINKGRIEMSPLGQEISFLASKPCTDGIMIHSVTNQYEGVYQFSIIKNLEDKQHITIQGTGVKLIKEQDLVYQIAVGSTRYVITSDTSISDIKPVVTTGKIVNISAAAMGVPATFSISFYKVKEYNKEVIGGCHNCRQYTKEATMDNGEDGISVEITPDISGMQPFLLTQPIIVNGSDSICCILLSILVILLSVSLIILGWYLLRRVTVPVVMKEAESNELLEQNLKSRKVALFKIKDLHKDVNQFYVRTKNQLDDYAKELSETKEELKTNKNLCISLEKEVTELNTKKEYVIKEMSNITDQLNNKQRELEHLKNENVNAKGHLQTQLDEKAKQCQSLRNQLDGSKILLEKKQKECDDLREDLKKNENQERENVKHEVNSIKEELKKEQHECKTLKQDIKKVTTELEKKQKECDDLKQDLNKKLEKKQKEYDDLKQDLNKKLEKKQMECDELKEDLKKKKTKK